MPLFHKIADLASDRYNQAREGNKLALVTEDIYVHLSDEIEYGRLSENDEKEIRWHANFIADGEGFTLEEILN